MKKSIKKIELKKKTVSLLNNAASGQLKGGNKPTSWWTAQSRCDFCPSIGIPCDSIEVCDSVNFC